MPSVLVPPLASSSLDAVRALQHALYRAAKADPGRRFHALYDKVHRRDVLQRAWGQVRRNNGAPGIDQTTLAEVEEYGVSRLLDELEAELKAGVYRPLPARRVFIPKPGTDERRPLSIPSVRDRVVQAAVKIVLEPVFEADFLPCSFGFRPKRAAHDGLQVLLDESFRGNQWVVETDVADCFGSIPHSGLMSAVEERISDRRLLALLRAFLRAGVMEQGSVRRPVTGTPQGGVVSPLLANVYLHRLDRAWRGGYGTLVRYADDALVMCRSQGQAVAALARLTVLLGRPRSGTEGGQDPDRSPEGGWRGSGLPRLPPPVGAVPGQTRIRWLHLLGPMALTQGGAARPRPHPVHDDAGAAGCPGRAGRAGDQPVPARLGGLLPVRQLRPCLRQDQELRTDAARTVHRETTSSVAGPGGSPRSTDRQPRSAWSPSMESSSHPGPTGPGGLRPNTAGEGRR